MGRPAVVIIVAAASVAAWLAWQQRRPVPFVVSGFIEADDVRVGSRVGGRVTEVRASEGQRVQPGEVLFTLDTFDWRQRLAQAESQLGAFQAEHARLTSGFRKEEIAQSRARRDRAAATLAKLRAGPRPQETEMTRERLNIARAELELAESEFERVKGLRAEASAAKVEFDKAVRELKRSRAQVAAAEQELALMEEGTRKEELAEAAAALAEAEAAVQLAEHGFRAEEIAQAAAQVASGQAQVDALRTQIEELTVVSPCECVVEGISLRPGDLVAANAPAVSLLDLTRLWVRTYVPEERLGEIRLGQRVPLRVDGIPGRRFAGTVTFLATDGEFTPRNIQTPEERGKQVFRAKITLEESVELLRVGMGADVLFDESVNP